MIAYLEGTIEFKAERFVVVNVTGVGYRVFVGTDTLAKLPERGASIKLWTHHHVRDDALELYGFLHPAELELFETLLAVPGVGPKGGLGILNVAPADTLKRAIASGDTSYLTRVSGIGKKTAEKIVLELKEKLAGRGRSVEAPELKAEVDALEALMALGYSRKEARDALAGATPDAAHAEERVRRALKRLGSSAPPND